MDDAPWGFAVSHYGRWTNLDGDWCWVPGPVRSRAYYAPALVAFVGGDNFQLRISSGNVGGIGWFPLAPREVYRPSYAVSRGYFENVNISNTVVNTTVINNTYNNSNVTNVVYANRQVAGAVIAVPTTAFMQSQPVAKAAVQVSREMIVNAPVAVVPRVAPTERSVRGAAAQGDRPPAQVFERPVVARTAPPAPHAGFAAQQQHLNATPGKPLDDAVRTQLKPAAAVPAPVVQVVVPAQAAPPTVLPPRVAPAGSAIDGRERTDGRKPPAVPPAPGAAVPAPAVPGAPPAEQRGRPDPRGNAETRAQPAGPVPPVQRAAEPKAVLPQAAPPAPAAQPPDQRGRPDSRGTGEPHAQPVAPSPPQRAKPELVPEMKPAEPRPPVAMPKAPPAPPQPAAKADPRGQEPKPALEDGKDKKKDKKKDLEDQKRDEENRK